MGEGSRDNLEFEYSGFRFLAYWCLTEGTTKFFPRVKALVKTPYYVLRRAHKEGVDRLQKSNPNRDFSSIKDLTSENRCLQSVVLSKPDVRSVSVSDLEAEVETSESLYEQIVELTDIA